MNNQALFTKAHALTKATIRAGYSDKAALIRQLKA